MKFTVRMFCRACYAVVAYDDERPAWRLHPPDEESRQPYRTVECPSCGSDVRCYDRAPAAGVPGYSGTHGWW